MIDLSITHNSQLVHSLIIQFHFKINSEKHLQVQMISSQTLPGRGMDVSSYYSESMEGLRRDLKVGSTLMNMNNKYKRIIDIMNSND